MGPTVINPNDSVVAMPSSSSSKHRVPFSHHHHPRTTPIAAKMTTSGNNISVIAQTHAVVNRTQAPAVAQPPRPKVEFLQAPEAGAIVEFLAEDGSYRLGLVSHPVEGVHNVWQVSERINQSVVHHALPLSRFTFYWPKPLTSNAYHFKVDDLAALTEQVQLELETHRSQLALHYGKWIESKAHSIRIETAAEMLFNGNPKLHQYYVTHRLLQESDAHVTPMAATCGSAVVTEYTFKPLNVMSSLSKTYLQKQQVTDHNLFLHRLARKIWSTREQGLVVLEAESLESYVSQLPELTEVEKRLNVTWNAHKDAPFLAQLKAFAFADEHSQMSGLLHTKATLLDPLDINATSESVFKLLVQIGVVGKYDNPFVARHCVSSTVAGGDLYFGASQMRDHLAKSATLAHVDRDVSFRRDYRNFAGPIFAIDGRLESSEIDDAIAAFRSPVDGSTWVHIHIADPSRFVSPNDTLDNLARARVQSVFLPEKVATMFPPNYSRHHFSLLPDKSNYALTFAVQLDPNSGKILNYEITPSVIDKVTALTYDQADDLILSAARKETPKLHRPVPQSHINALKMLLDLSETRRRYRERAGAVFMDQMRPEVEVCNNGETINVNAVRDSESATRGMVSELMILVGEVTALFASRHKIPIPYRSQAKRTEKILTINNAAGALATSSSVAATAGLSSSLSVAQLPPGSPSAASTSSSARTRLFPAITAVEPGEHAGLGLPAYCQATSPIRRYTDLLVHHQIKSFLRGEMPPFSAAKLSTMLMQLEETQGRLNTLSSNSSRYWILRFLERQDPSKHYEALVSSDIIPSMTYGASQCVAWLLDLGWKTPITLSPGRVPASGDRIQVQVHRIDAFNDDVEFIEVATDEPPYSPVPSPSL
jgi:exoribonuclease-2